MELFLFTRRSDGKFIVPTFGSYTYARPYAADNYEKYKQVKKLILEQKFYLTTMACTLVDVPKKVKGLW